MTAGEADELQDRDHSRDHSPIDICDRLSENALIASLLAPLAGPAGLGLKDDAALLAPPEGCELVLSMDGLVAGIHFFPDDPPASIARKALGVNLSDLAAKGADPVGFLLTLMIPDHLDNLWIKDFIDGLGEAARAARCPLIGGDTTRTPGPLAVTIMVIGAVPLGRMVRRTTAQTGDVIAVTGTIGDAALGLRLQSDVLPEALAGLDTSQRGFLLDRYRHPQARNVLAACLRDHASAAMDVSDGLVGDARKLLAASGRGGLIRLDDVPLSPAAATVIDREASLFECALTGGDDYEILFCVSPDRFVPMQAEASALGVTLTAIGLVSDALDVVLIRQGRAMNFTHGSFEHF